jgi:predicted RNA binding protein YcfA (HicA-like mRNA interferase family)
LFELKPKEALHPVRATKIVKALVKIGFEARPTKVSHVLLKNKDGRTTVVPIHPGEEIDRSLIRKIASDVQMNPEEFMFLIDES